MTTVSINVTNISNADSNGNRSATYTINGTANPPSPNWAAVASDGDVHLEEAPNSGAIVINWTLVSPPDNLTFSSGNPFSAPSAPAGTFTPPTTGGGTSVSVTDNNNSAAGATYEYTLALSDNSKLDPKFINK